MRHALSYSRYTNTDCWWKWRKVYLDKAPTLAADYLEFGSIIHELIHDYLQLLVKIGEDFAPHLADGVFLEYVRTATDRDGKPKPFIKPDAIDEERRLLQKFAGWFRLDRARLWQLEAPMAITWDGEPCDWWAPDVWLRAKPDLPYVDGPFAELWDWKSARYALPNDEAVQTHLQAKTLGLIFHRFNPAIHEARVNFAFIRYGVVRRGYFQARDFAETLDFWKATSDALEERLTHLTDPRWWLPTPGDHCATCPVALQCPLLTTALPNVTAATPEIAQQLAGLVLVSDASAKAGKALLKASVEANGPLTMHGVTFDFYPVESYAYPTPGRMMAKAEKHFLDPHAIIKVDTEALDKVMKKNRAFADEVRAERTETGATQFRYKKSALTVVQPEALVTAGPPAATSTPADAGASPAPATPIEGSLQKASPLPTMQPAEDSRPADGRVRADKQAEAGRRASSAVVAVDTPAPEQRGAVVTPADRPEGRPGSADSGSAPAAPARRKFLDW